MRNRWCHDAISSIDDYYGLITIFITVMIAKIIIPAYYTMMMIIIRTISIDYCTSFLVCSIISTIMV